MVYKLSIKLKFCRKSAEFATKNVIFTISTLDFFRSDHVNIPLKGVFTV